MSIDEQRIEPIKRSDTDDQGAEPGAPSLAALSRGPRLSEATDWRSRVRKFNRRFFYKNPLNVVDVAIILVFIFLTIFGTTLANARGEAYDPEQPKCEGRNSCITRKLEGP